jgi:P27 family predicted phage terminase small subunit
MSFRGRPPKPLEDHEMQGTYRADRHGEPNVKFRPDGYAKKPEDLGEWGIWVWDFIIGEMNRKEVASEIDSIALGEACRWYDRYRRFGKIVDDAPDLSDKSIYRLLISTKMCWEKFEDLASKFGLDPASRMRLHLKPAESPSVVPTRQRGAS